MAGKNLLLRPLLHYFDYQRPICWPEVFGNTNPLVVEIGFGLGEVITQKARENPGTNFIGIENHWERIFKTLKRIERVGENSIANIRILNMDATVAFERCFDQKTISHVYSLFPCPWPKKKHAKHRLFSSDSLRLINNRLKPQSDLWVVTDYFPYTAWIDEQAFDSGFLLNHKKIEPRFDTKFEKKWRQEGQEAFFELTFIKEKHKDVFIKRNVLLKNYNLPSFDLKKFNFKESKGEATVVCRDIFFDADKNICLIHTLVAEENLTQDFWAAIHKTDKGWLLKRADGHYFFPTPGIAYALECIYQAAKESGNQ